MGHLAFSKPVAATLSRRIQGLCNDLLTWHNIGPVAMALHMLMHIQMGTKLPARHSMLSETLLTVMFVVPRKAIKGIEI